MITLYKNARVLCGDGKYLKNGCVAVNGKIIEYVGEKYDGNADCEIDCGGNLLIPALYNAHCHSAMTLFRGYGENLPLQRWLDEKILPAEDRLTPESVRVGSMLAIAEMIRNGVVSFSDAYMFEDVTAECVADTGVKANLARGVVSFDPDQGVKNNRRVSEAIDLVEKYHGKCDGRVLIDLSLHAEYTNVEKMCREFSEYGREKGLRMQVHLAETKHEVEGCYKRRGCSPVKFFADCGVFDMPTTAAHCIYVDDDDIKILADKKVFVAHNPVSNLKLGSGVMPFRKLSEAGINICLGTDGAASNNTLDIIKEMQTAALIHKGVETDPTLLNSCELLPLASRNGALSQGRGDCGFIRKDFRADLVLIDTNNFHTIPEYDPEVSLAYSIKSSDVLMTVCDGRILYRNGTYNSIDTEKLMSEAKRVIGNYFD